ncbi:MAG: hypothetical protein NVS9B3_00440 [Gemmatimonadaceae bacterium]
MQLPILAAAIAVATLLAAPRAAAAQGASLPMDSTARSEPRAPDSLAVARSAVLALAPVRVEAAPEERSLGYRLWHIDEERHTVLSLRRENRRLEHELREYDRTIDRLERRLARAKLVHDSLHVARLAAKPRLDAPSGLEELVP